MDRGVDQEIETETDCQQKVLSVCRVCRQFCACSFTKKKQQITKHCWLPKVTSFYTRIAKLIYSD